MIKTLQPYLRLMLVISLFCILNIAGFVFVGQASASNETVFSAVYINDNSSPASIMVDTTADCSSAGIGNIITYTYRIKNNGPYDLTRVEFYDDKLTPVGTKDDLGPLAANQQITVTKTYTVQNSDPIGDLINNVTITGHYSTTAGDNIITAKGSVSVAILEREVIIVEPEPIMGSPAKIKNTTAQPEPQPESKPEGALPNTGGNPVASILLGIAFCSLGIFIGRRNKAMC